MALDESAMIDGANKWQIFTKITLPLSKPIIVYTSLTAFMGLGWILFSQKLLWVIKLKITPLRLVSFDDDQINSQFTIHGFYSRMCADCHSITILFILMQRFYVEGVTSGSVRLEKHRLVYSQTMFLFLALFSLHVFFVALDNWTKFS